MKHKIFLNSEGGRTACDEQEAPSNDQQNFHLGRSVQIQKGEFHCGLLEEEELEHWSSWGAPKVAGAQEENPCK